MVSEVVVDGSFGSCSKGRIVEYLLENPNHGFTHSYRGQSVNSAHQIYYKDKKIRVQSIPCAWVDTNIKLVIGTGSSLTKEILMEEIKMISELTGQDVRDRLYIDYRASWITEEDVEEEKKFNLFYGMGSTGKGVGANMRRRMLRQKDFSYVDSDSFLADNGIKMVDTIEMYYNENGKCLIEGSQGAMLSLLTSPYRGYTTTRQCSWAGIVGDLGIDPFTVDHVHIVNRSYPIRVSSWAGPTGGDPISWEDLAVLSGNPNLKPEITTLSNRQRQAFIPAEVDLRHALNLNSGYDLEKTTFYLTFVDYFNFADSGKNSWEEISDISKQKIKDFEKLAGRRIDWIGTGETSYVKIPK